MATWRKEEAEADRDRQEKRTRKHRTYEATQIGLLKVDQPKESCTGARRTEACVAPRHKDASRDAILHMCSFFPLCCTRSLFYFYFIPSERAAWGGGGAAKLSLFVIPSLFSRP